MNANGDTLPVFTLRNTVLLPFMLAPFSAGRKISISAIEAALEAGDKTLAVVTQKDAALEAPGRGDLYRYGVKASVARMQRSEETVEVILQGMERIELLEQVQETPHLKFRIRSAPVPRDNGPEVEAMQQEILELASRFQKAGGKVPDYDIQDVARQVKDPMHLIYFVAAVADLDTEKAQTLLEADTHRAALNLLHGYLTYELRIRELREEIAEQAQSTMGREQREYLLRQQLRAIQQELGEGEGGAPSELADLRRQLDETELPEQVRSEAEREMKRLETIPPSSPEHQVIHNYLEMVLDLPWSKSTEDKLDMTYARQVLDEDHYGLKEIKERILEQLAVMKLNPEAKAPILCFVGPPGTGKTSLGKSIARALGRKFERFSLGGLHDESELRGHRRTYIGAMPGRIIQAMRRAGVNNPLLMLDEVDKLGRDFRGDPASALLEILDPAQNFEFRDNYLDLPFDLSKTFFISTANTLDTIPGPLLDRMETITLSGYSDEEKQQIARRYLLDRQRWQAGLTPEQFEVSDEALLAVIHRYTREAGVRNLERTLGQLARKVALDLAEGRTQRVVVTPDNIEDILGPRRFTRERARKEMPPGVAAGLAWTPAGGEVLYVEAILLPEGEQLTLTGQLGDVMRESARAAQNYILSRSASLGFDTQRTGVHIHVPAGAIPKDGPSAGVTMAAALTSLYTGLPMRDDTAMTGEVTLTGLVLPVGGIKEKVLAAHRAGIRRIILPADNEPNTRGLPDHVREQMTFIYAGHVEDVLAAAIPGISDRLQAA